VRPIGDWSIRRTVSISSSPSRASCSRELRTCCRSSGGRGPCRTRRASTWTFLEPETPVMAVKHPIGMSTSRSLRLCWRAPDREGTVGIPALVGNRDLLATGEVVAGDRSLGRFDLLDGAVGDDLAAALAGPGPISMTASARRIVSSSCSTTSRVLPRSRSSSRVSSSRSLSRWWSPIEARRARRGRRRVRSRSALPGGCAGSHRRKASRPRGRA